MPIPTYHVRGGWLTGDWVEISSKWNWAQIAGNFRWEELQAGPLPDVDVEEIQIARKVGTMFDRLTTGEARAQLDNSRGQYTGSRSAQNLLHYSDNPSSYGVLNAANVSLSVLVGKTGAIDAYAVAETNAGDFHTLRTFSSISVVSGQQVMLAGEFYAGTRDRFLWRLQDSGETHSFEAAFSLRSMTVAAPSATGSATALGASMQVLGGGWVRCWVNGTLPGLPAQAKLLLVNSAGVSSYTGTGSAWVGARAWQVAQGSVLPVDFVATAGDPLLPRDTFISPNDVFTVKAMDGSSVYCLFSGYIQEWGFNPALKDVRKLQLSAFDVADRLRPIITTSVQLNVTHRTIAQTVLSEAALDPLQYTIDGMNDLAAVSFLDQMSAGEALAVLQQNGCQLYYVDGAGRLRLRSRHWDVTSTPVVASTAVAFAMTVGLATDSIINRLELSTVPRRLMPDVTTVAWISEAVYVPASNTRQFILDFVDPETNETGVPCINPEPQVRGLDYVFNVAPTGEGPDLTSQVVVVASVSATAAYVTVSNPGGLNGYLTVCQIRAQPARRQPVISRFMNDDASIAQYQERYTSIQADLLGTDNRLRDLGEFLLSDRAQPKRSLSFSLQNEWPSNVAVDLLDRMAVYNSLANVGSVFAVMELEHTLQFGAGVQHATKYVTQLVPIKNWFTLDSPTLGRLDFNRLGA